MTRQDVEKVYDTLMSMPGMTEQVKIDFKIDRKTVLLLSQVIERGLNAGGGSESSFGLIDNVGKESIDLLKSLAADALEKAGMTELNTKLSALKAE